MTFGRRIRDRWLLADELAFLNHGSFGACPREVLAVQRALQDELEQEPVRFMDQVRGGRVREAAAACAPFLGARAEDLVFVDNATTGVAAVLWSMRFTPGDVLLSTSHGYGAVEIAMRHVAARVDARVEVVPVPFPIEDPAQVVHAVAASLHERVKLVIVDWITSPTGLVFPIGELVALCRSRGIPVLVDGAHVPGHVPCDLEALGADWFVGNAHKWLFAPKGSAFLWARPERQRELHPPVLSWGYGSGWHAEFDFLGTRDPSPWLATPAALAFRQRLGVEQAAEYCSDLRENASGLLREAWGTEPLAPASMLGNLCTIRLPFDAPAEPAVAARLHAALFDRHGIEVPIVPFAGRCWLRISAQVYNELEEYERLARAVGPDGIR